MEFESWNLPKGLNLDILLDLTSEKRLLGMIESMANKSRNERRVIFPSRVCLRKCLVYYLVEKFNEDFDAVLDVLKGHEKTLGKIHKANIRKLWENRKKEIENDDS